MDYIDEYRLFDLAWEGRNLVYLGESVAGELDIYYEYNDEGIRTSKTVADTEYKYTLNGSQIVSQEWDNKLIIFFYDETGSPIGYGYRTTSMTANTFYYYVYEKNLQGDIVAIYNTSGTKLISYTYDAWGNVSVSNINISGTNAGAQYNPFRYRGYYYDEEVGLYYLNSRYYDPRTGRFLNADSYISTGTGLLGYNMYAYCNNNPISYIDYTGKGPITFLVVVGVTIGVFLGAYIVPTYDDIQRDAESHYSRNEKNKVDKSVEDIMNSYDLQPEGMDQYHENTTGKQGSDAIYNNKYLSPNGGHYEIIICEAPGKKPYIVDESVDPLNMGTYNYASNDNWSVIYGIDHFFRDMVPYYLYGNTREDSYGVLKWIVN